MIPAHDHSGQFIIRCHSSWLKRRNIAFQLTKTWASQDGLNAVKSGGAAKDQNDQIGAFDFDHGASLVTLLQTPRRMAKDDEKWCVGFDGRDLVVGIRRGKEVCKVLVKASWELFETRFN